MISKKAIALIESFEACSLEAYECQASKRYTDPSKKFYTIGWGNTFYENGNKIGKNDKITQEQADKLFYYVLEQFEQKVKALVKVPLNENQLGALVSFAYNTGIGNFSKSTLLEKLNAKDFRGAEEEFHKWNKAGGQPSNGLIRRRKQEVALFTSV